MPFSLAQQRALAIVPKVSGAISMIGSTLIVCSVLRDKKKRQKIYHRILCAISLVDFSASLACFLSTWPIPKESGVLWAVGTQTTCNAQAFLAQCGIASSIYNAGLSTRYLLVIRYNWTEARLRKKEWLFHAIPFAWGLGTGIAGLVIGINGNAFLWCWISLAHDTYRWLFWYGPLWLMIIIITVNCVLIWLHVHKIDQAALKWERRISFLQIKEGNRDQSPENGSSITVPPSVLSSTRNVDTCSHKVSRQVAVQSFLYSAAFYINKLPITLTRLLQTINGQVYFPLIFISAATIPILGLPNFLVYLRPRFLELRKQKPEAGVIRLAYESFIAPGDNEEQEEELE